MSFKKIIILLILALIYTLTLTAQNTPLEVYVHDNYTDKPLESVLVSVFQNGVVIDSAYTDINGIAVISGVTSVREPVGIPSTMSLSHNYPNPFREETNVELGIPETQTITATVYNILGQRVASEQMQLSGGYYTLNMSLGNLPTGVYFLKIDGRETRAVKLLKMGRGIHPAAGVFSVSPSSLPGGATIGKVAGDEYTLRAVKERYDVYESSLEQPLRSGVTVLLARNNQVEFVVVDGENNPVAKQLDIKIHDYQTTITTPHTVTLKSGVYKAMGEVEQGISLERTVEIPSVDTTVVLSFEETGVKLEGAPDAPAIGATYDLNIPIVYPEETISIDPDLLYDGHVLRTEIEVITDPDATIAEVNGILEKYNAQIVSMLQDNTIFIIRVPDPGDVASLNQLIADIENEGIVLFALKSVIVEDPEPLYDSYRPEELQRIPVHITAYDRIDHHLAVRAHAAWNMRGAITELNNRPWIVIGDAFGGGTPGTGYNASFRHADFATGNTCSHGYHVLGIIAGQYDQRTEMSAERNDVTGLFPERLRIRAVDLQSATQSTWPQRMFSIILKIREILISDPSARIVVNTSLNSRALPDQKEMALSWIMRVRGVVSRATVGAGLENSFIHITSAGNAGVVGGDIVSWPAQDNSMFAYAALVDIIHNNVMIPRITNTFVVENRVNTLHQQTELLRQRPLPGCASRTSIMGGNISAMGTRVWSFGKRVDGVHFADSQASNKSGTSMATPQAAGVAAYVWAVNPNLSVTEVMDIIRRTTEERATTTLTPGVTCNQEVPQPVIDAYAAVLAAGGADARRVLLDVKGNGLFDHNDIEEFLGVYLDTLKAGKLDYSRYDLNGDGFTGGGSTDRFDLSMDGKYTDVSQLIEGDTMKYDEKYLTDMEILCYYAYSELYKGDTKKRLELLDGLCTLKDIDSNVYKIVRIGKQMWMAENLKVSRYRNGDSISNPEDWYDWEHTDEGAWSYYNNDAANKDKYGKLYNWYAVSDSRGLCPEGWHVPTVDDWTTLENYLRPNIGAKLKSTRTYPDSHPRWDAPNEGATNESGFSGLPGGERRYYGPFADIGRIGNWWSSTEIIGSDGRPYNNWRSARFDRIDWLIVMGGSPEDGFSVRCLKD